VAFLDPPLLAQRRVSSCDRLTLPGRTHSPVVPCPYNLRSHPKSCVRLLVGGTAATLSVSVDGISPRLTSHDGSVPEKSGRLPPPLEPIAVRADDENVALVQLAARWAEAFAPPEGDSQRALGTRFRFAFEYLDAVIHGVNPADTAEA
jgi:hypothetical protein